MPHVSAGVGVDSDDTICEKLIAASKAALKRVLGLRSVSTKVKQVEFRVISDGVPYGSATSVLPPVFAPSLRRHSHCRGFKPLLGVSRNRVETPQMLTGLSI